MGFREGVPWEAEERGVGCRVLTQEVAQGQAGGERDEHDRERLREDPVALAAYHEAIVRRALGGFESRRLGGHHRRALTPAASRYELKKG